MNAGPVRTDRTQGRPTDPFGVRPDPSADPTSTEQQPRPEQARPGKSAPLAIEAPPPGSLPERIKQRMVGALAELRFVSERPPSLVDHLAYARRGEWTEEIDGPRRHLAVLFAWVMTVPISLAYLVAWWCARPGRFFSVAVVVALVVVALEQVL